MEKYTTTNILSNNDNAQNSSKCTTTTFSDSSNVIFAMNDNGMLTNKKVFIQYGNSKRDYRLEMALKRLNAIILDCLDDSANCVITAINRKKPENDSENANNISPMTKATAIGSRARKLVGLVQQKTSTTASPLIVSNKDHAFLDQVAQRGIRVLHINSVWKWLHKHHSLLIIENDEDCDFMEAENDTRDFDNDVRKIIAPSLKIIDVTNQTRPSYHSKCIFPKSMYQETEHLFENEQSNNDTKPVQQVVTTKKAHLKTKKSPKMPTKIEGGFCECCNANYCNLSIHLVSASHKEFALDAKNFTGIDEVVSGLGNLSAFLTMRTRKQTIMDKMKKKTKLLKTMSANDFKKENNPNKKLSCNPNIKKAISMIAKEHLQMRYTDVLETDIVEENVSAIENMEITPCQGDVTVVKEGIPHNVIKVQGECYSMEKVSVVVDGVVSVIDPVPNQVRAMIDIERSWLNMADVSEKVFHCNTEWLERAEFAEHFTVDLQRLKVIVNDNEEEMNCVHCITIVRSILQMVNKEVLPNILWNEGKYMINKPDLDKATLEFDIEYGSPLSGKSWPLAPVLTPNFIDIQHNNPSTNDSIIDLKQYTESSSQTFNVLTKTSLKKAKPLHSLDNLVTNIFKNSFDIDLPVTAVKKAKMQPAKVQVIHSAAKSRGSVNRVNTQQDSCDNASGGRLSRRAKIVARDSITLTTNMFLN